MKKKLLYVVGAVVVLLVAVLYLLDRFHFLPQKKYSNEDFNISAYTSAVDQDGDGIDDQTDLLNSVRAYIETKPKYKSKYYSTGYPDDEYGVCTDVVGAGMKGAGYDLMELVHAHIEENRELYAIDKVDKNIDFRRVRNLKVYFDHTAISLTTDCKEIEEWQGGDIVIFKNHIGVVSDKRNKKGIPFVIHHANPYQRYYEEDILENRKDVIGHYRVS